MEYNRKNLKKAARSVLRRHYGLFVTVILIATLLGTVSQGSRAFLRIENGTYGRSASYRVLEKAIEGDINGAVKIAQDNMIVQEDRDVKIGDVQFGHQQGILAEIFNKRASGSFIASLASAIFNVADSTREASIILMIVALIVIAVVTVFISETYRIIYTRIFMVARIYKRVDFASFLFLLRTKTWVKVSLAYLYYHFVMLSWSFTIVGGIIKHYSYACTRYILAENPTLSGRQAMKLSSEMMNGHKWELFMLDVSFVGWHLLSLISLRLIDILFLIPYKEATYTEYYTYIRGLAVAPAADSSASTVDGASKMLKDVYLYEYADEETINAAYRDAIDVLNSPDISVPQPSKFRAFLQNVFGIVLIYDDQEEEYRRVMTQKAKVQTYKHAIEKKSYPARLCPTPIAAGRAHMEHVQYMRHYSMSSLILIFFVFCFCGWLWEVAIHLVNDGVFVNRGSLHGPWLPIYGTGAVMILAVLNKLRKKPALEFAAAIVLCGIVEYSGSYALEKIHGAKWWDYTGYFFNINGRICAEGLLVFGVAGMSAVYFLAPILDNSIRKIKDVVRRTICIVLVVIFAIDYVYSQFVPNTGAGITDYAQVEEETTNEHILLCRS